MIRLLTHRTLLKRLFVAVCVLAGAVIASDWFMQAWDVRDARAHVAPKPSGPTLLPKGAYCQRHMDDDRLWLYESKGGE